MSNYRRNGPSAESRPRDDNWGARWDQYRDQPSRNNPTWNPGETSRDARRNDYSQPGSRNRPEFPSSGQYIPMSRRNQFESDRRPEGRVNIDSRSISAFTPATTRRPPTAPRDQHAVPRNERALVDESRRRDLRHDESVSSTAGFERSR